MHALIVIVVVLVAWSAQAADVCQEAWEKADRLRMELGLQVGPKPRPHDPLLPPEACQMVLDTPEADARRLLLEFAEIKRSFSSRSKR